MKKNPQNVPLKLICFYFILTLVISLFGPVEYYEYNYFPVILFMFSIIIAILIGYRMGDFKFLIKRRSNPQLKHYFDKSTVIKFVEICIIIALIIEILQFISNITTFSVTSISTIFGRIINIGGTYREVLSLQRQELEVSRLGQIITLLGLIKQVSIVGFIFFKKEIKLNKYTFYLFFLLNLINVVAFSGQQKVLGDIIIYSLGTVIVKQIVQKRKINYKLIALLGSVTTFTLFGAIQLSRANTYGYSFLDFSTPFFRFNSEHIIYKIFGNTIGSAIASVLYYISGGYYGLSQTFKIPFEWTYGIGNSIALSSYGSQYFGINNMLEHTYVFRSESITGYPALQYWSTIFPWLASDFTFIGTIVVVSFIAKLYAITWKESLNSNFISILLFTRLNILWLYTPANNQLMQTRESAIATIALLIIWVVFHKRVINESRC
jgi:hypothetical protein